jgi:hypothetical protein
MLAHTTMIRDEFERHFHSADCAELRAALSGHRARSLAGRTDRTRRHGGEIGTDRTARKGRGSTSEIRSVFFDDGACFGGGGS